jgi:hypothetical protein
MPSRRVSVAVGAPVAALQPLPRTIALLSQGETRPRGP